MWGLGAFCPFFAIFAASRAFQVLYVSVRRGHLGSSHTDAA